MSHARELEYESARAQIYRWAYRLLQNEHDALDATQAVLLKALNTPTVSRESRERRDAWLRKVTINHCIDQIRRRRERVEHVDAVSHEPCETEKLEQAERRERITAALQHLTDLQRIVLLAKVYDRETFEDIAKSLSISASSVKTHYVRALKKMRQQLAPYEGARR